MANTRKMGLTLAQVLVGGCCGVLAGGISLYLINLLWGGLKQVDMGNFFTALLLLASFLIIYGIAIVATAEGVKLMGGRFIPKQISRRRIYEGSFLGMCAAVALVSVTRGDWLGTLSEWGGLVRGLGTAVYFVVVLPVKFATIWVPPLLFLMIAAPIGAAIAYNMTPDEKKKAEDSEEKPAKGGEKKS